MTRSWPCRKPNTSPQRKQGERAVLRLPRWRAGLVLAVLTATAAVADEPPAINPFGNRSNEREDAVPGFVEMSDGAIHPGRIYLTRDARLQIYDRELKRRREAPLRVVEKIECQVVKQWMEKEWRFKENASNEKFYTGRTYPAREYEHTTTLHDGRTIKGPLSALMYVQPDNGGTPLKLILHHRDKGEIGSDLESLKYVRFVKFGDEAFQEAVRRAHEQSEED